VARLSVLFIGIMFVFTCVLTYFAGRRWETQAANRNNR
jgi:hypothetical protein